MYWYNMATGKSAKTRSGGAPSIEEYEGTLGADGSAECTNNNGESEDGEGDSTSGARGLLIKADDGATKSSSKPPTHALTLKIEVQIQHFFFLKIKIQQFIETWLTG